MPTTSNFGWTTPADTDLVKDGALAIRTLGNGIDTSLLDLKGGTTGQILSKASNTDLDYTWINNDQGDITNVGVTSPITGGGSSGSVTIGIQDGTTTQKGAVQLENSTSSTSTTTAAVPASVKSAYDLANAAIPKTLTTTTGDIIYASAANTPARLGIGSASQVLTVSGGVPTWATPASGGGMTLLDSGSFTGASVTTATLSTSYYDLYVVVRNFQPVSDAHLRVRFNADSGTNYSENGIDYDSYAYSVAQHNEVGMAQDSAGTQSLITFTVPDYANTSTYKILFVPAALTANATTPANAQYSAGRISAWKSTAAVTSLTFFCSTGNFTAGSYRVYGVK